MSRSRKKIPVIKDKKPKDNSYNKIFRRTNKQRLHSNKDLKTLRELVNDYDICDYWFMEDSEKFYRK